MKKLYSIAFFIVISLTIATSTNGIMAQIVNIPDANFKALLVSNLSINTNADGNIQVSEATAYSGSLDASGMSIADLTGIEAFTSLTSLDCSFNSLTNLDLTYNVALTSVYCTSNSLTTLNVANLPYLDFLDCSINNLTCLDVHTDTALTTLNCGTNNLTSLNLKSGHNSTLLSMNAMSAGGMLYCVQVDNIAAAVSAPGWMEDTWSTYNTVCGTSPTASFTSDALVCFGTPVTFTDASLFAASWFWDFGDGTSSNLQNPSHTYANGGSFNVSLTASNCNSSNMISQSVAQGSNVYGHVSYSGGNVTSGQVIIYPHQPINIAFDTLQIQPLDAFGNYTFTNIIDGDYLIKVFVDTIAYPTLCPTYYTSNWAWDSSSLLTHGCVLDDMADISMVEMSGGGGGVGLLHGWVVEGLGFGRAPGDPINGVDVKLGVTSTQQIVASTQTDLFGNYTFGNVPFGNYTIYVDIPGLLRDSVYDIVVDASNTQFLDLNYLVDSATIYVLPNIGIEDQHLNDFQFNIFPNPVRGNATLQYILKNQGKVSIDIYNVVGIKVQTLINTEQESGEYQLTYNPSNASLKPGIYFISLSVNGKVGTKRIVILE